eukprot:418125-Karenia_brevis.AAC.1
MHISSSNGATRCQRPPLLQADMTALKLITSSDRPPLRISSSNGATCCHCHPPFSQAGDGS